MNGEEDETAKAVKEMKEMIRKKNTDDALVSKNKTGSEPAAEAEFDETREDEGEIEQDIVDKGTGSDSDAVEVRPSKARLKSGRQKA